MELSSQWGCLLWGGRVIVSEVGQSKVLQELHEAHPESTLMKWIAWTLLRWLRRAPNVLFAIWKYAKVSLYFVDVLLQLTETEWLLCEGFLALLAVLWLLVCTVQVFAIDDCQVDRSNSQQDYDWTKSFVFLEARNGKVARARLFSSWPQQPDAPPPLPDVVLNLREFGV